MATTCCPQCGEILRDRSPGQPCCQACGATLPVELYWRVDSAGTMPPPGERAPEDDRDRLAGAIRVEEETPRTSKPDGLFDTLPAYPGAADSPEPAWADAKIRRSDHGETLAVLALLLPVVAIAVTFAWHFNSLGIELAIGWGTVAVTALLMAIDAAFLGRVDLGGTERAGPVALFFGMCFLWVLGYPVAFFRRRHFGRPNLGPLALVVAVCFVAAPFIQNFLRFGVLGAGVPSCTSREVIDMVNDSIRDSPDGPSVQSISGHREVSHDPANKTRKGQCIVKTRTETITAGYTVKIMDPTRGTFQVQVDTMIADEPPACTAPEVIQHLERTIRQARNGQLLRVQQHKEVRYDEARKIRHGQCEVVMGAGRSETIRFQVFWLDQKLGQFQVQLEP